MLFYAETAYAARLVLAAVFIGSGWGKISSPGSTVQAVRALGLPSWLGRGLLPRLFPWAEIILGALLGLGAGLWLAVPAGIGLLLSAAFTVLVARAVRRGSSAPCSCFGASQTPMSWWTVARNIWLSLLAAVVLHGSLLPGTPEVSWAESLSGAAILIIVFGLGASLAASEGKGAWAREQTSAGLVPSATSSTAGGTAGKPAAASSSSSGESSSGETEASELDYVRRANPAVALESLSREGSLTLTTELWSQEPVLVLLVSETCSACLEMRNREGELRELLPTAKIVYIFSSTTEVIPDAWTDTELDVFRDPHDVFAQLAGSMAVPALVLMGADGLLAAGPEYGSDAIIETAAEIAEVLTSVAGGHADS